MSQLIIYSEDRISGTASDFTIEIPVMSNSHTIALLSAHIPNTLYNIYDGGGAARYDELVWQRNAIDYTAYLTSGAYAITDLVSHIATVMLATDAAGGYTCSYSPVTMKLTIASTDATFYLKTATNSNLWRTLGWTYNTTTPTDTAPAMSQTGDMVVRLDFPPHLFIDIGLPSANCVTTGWKRTNFVISMTNVSQYVEVYNRNDTFDQLQSVCGHPGINTLKIRLTKPDGELCELNGAEWSMQIGIEC